MSPGEGIGNGRATTLRFSQEGARILAVDRLIASAEEIAAMATQTPPSWAWLFVYASLTNNFERRLVEPYEFEPRIRPKAAV